jgi:hypothetical protein
MLFACRARSAVAHPLAMVMVIFPLTFYLTHASLRYRFPMDPVMLILAVFAVGYVVSPAARRPAEEQTRTTAPERGNEAAASAEAVTVLQ